MTDRELIRELIKRLDLKLVEKPVGKVIAIDEYTECTGIVRLGVGIVSWDTNGMRVLRQTKARVR